VGGAMSSLRLLQTGRPYQLPPLTSGLAPDSVKGLEEWRAVVERAAAIAAEAAADKASRRRPQQSAK
ncbi:NFACT-R_1 domain-containing protein, partial [Haematococcus lacustris]